MADIDLTGSHYGPRVVVYRSHQATARRDQCNGIDRSKKTASLMACVKDITAFVRFAKTKRDAIGLDSWVQLFIKPARATTAAWPARYGIIRNMHG